MVPHQGQPVGKEQLGGLQGAEPGLELGKRLKGRTRGLQREQGHGSVSKQRPQPDPDGRDHRERPLGPGEQPDQVVAGVLLGQRLQPRQGRAVRKHRLQAHDLLAHGAVSQDALAARVGGDQPADRGRVPRREVDTEVQPHRANRLLQGGERHAGAHGDLACHRIDGPDVTHPGRAQDHLAAARDPATDEPGVATLGHHGDPVPAAQLQHRPDVAGVGWSDDASGVAGEAPGPVGLVGRRHRGVDEDMSLADGVAEVCFQGHDSTRSRTVSGIRSRACTTSGA